MKQFDFCFCFYRYVKNLTTGREGWIPANNLLMLIGNSKSAQSLSSSGRLLTINGCLSEDSCYGRKLWKNNHISFDFSLFFPRIRHCFQHFEHVIKLQ